MRREPTGNAAMRPDPVAPIRNEMAAGSGAGTGQSGQYTQSRYPGQTLSLESLRWIARQ
jgi:hypothetical protein